MRIEDQRVHHRLIQIMIDPVRELTGRDQLFAVRALHGVLGRGAAEHEVDRRCDAVDIAGRRDIPIAAVLFFRCISPLDDHRYALGSQRIADRAASRPEIEQLHLARFGHIDVVRRDVPVDDAFLVHLFQRVQQWDHDRSHLIAGQLSFAAHAFLHGLSFHIFHHEIGRAVFRKAVIDRDDAFFGVEHRQPPRFFREVLPPLLKQGAALIRIDGHRALGVDAGGEVHRQIFLDRYLLTQKGIPANVGNAKTSIAQHVPNIETIVEQRSGQQLIRLCPAFFRLVTVWTAIQRIRIFFHAMITPHPFIPPLLRVPPLRDKTAADNLLYSETAFPG